MRLTPGKAAAYIQLNFEKTTYCDYKDGFRKINKGIHQLQRKDVTTVRQKAQATEIWLCIMEGLDRTPEAKGPPLETQEIPNSRKIHPLSISEHSCHETNA